MKQKLLFVSVFFLLFVSEFSQAQNASSGYLLRATTGVAGSSENISVNNKSYLVQQSIGQASAIGTFYDSDYIVRQGFIQPNVLAKIRDSDIPLSLEAIVYPTPLSLEAIVYPNPFIQSITISFTENISGKVNVVVFDLYGQHIFSKSYRASQEIKVQFGNLSVANYILKVTANNKQFIKKLIKN